MSEIENAFNAFCAFGSARGKSNTDLSSLNTMDNQRFAKFFKDCGVTNTGVATTDVDIIFNKVKQKSSRRIDFNEFDVALGLLAEIKYKKPNKS
jgi:HrpA-like RNA helicase